MLPLDNPVRRYDWGSLHAIPRLLGLPPDGGPQAELWMGGHPAAPSLARRDGHAVPLDALVGQDPAGVLGERTLARFGPRMPYLFKVLAAERPLSLQVHPSAEQAARGFADEEAAGVPLDAPHRRYRDPWHKPELVWALTPFEALCGFRPPRDTARLLTALGVDTLDEWARRLSGPDPTSALRDVVGEALGGGGSVGPLLGQVVQACRARADAPGRPAADGGSVPDEVVYRTVVDLAAAYPGDPGVLVALLLNQVRLSPGEALYLPAGNVHAYLHGTALEIMAGSDNVLRGGLTSKHVDVPELLRVVDFTARPVPYAHPVDPAPGGTSPGVWRTAAPEFELTVTDASDASCPLAAEGPRIVLCLEGRVTLSTPGGTHVLDQGRSVFVAHGDGPLAVTGSGRVAVAAARQDGPTPDRD